MRRESQSRACLRLLPRHLVGITLPGEAQVAEPFRTYEQDDDDDQEGDDRAVLEGHPEPVAGEEDAEVLAYAYQVAAGDGAADAGEATQDGCRDDAQKRHPAHLRVDWRVDRPECAG